jgi:thiol-disulfide isomerase/thioredoxin
VIWRSIVAASVLITLAACGGDDDTTSGATTIEPSEDAVAEVGQPAPEVTYETFEGETASLADYEGRPLVVNFWASWCGPCITEMPAFEQVHQQLGDEVAFLGLNVQDTVEDGQRFVDRMGVTWDLGRDPDGTLVQRLGGIGMPTTVLIDADGVVREINTGELDADELTSLIEEHLL